MSWSESKVLCLILVLNVLKQYMDGPFSAIYIKTYPRQSAYNDLLEKNRVCRHEFKSDTVSKNTAQGHPKRG